MNISKKILFFFFCITVSISAETTITSFYFKNKERTKKIVIKL